MNATETFPVLQLVLQFLCIGHRCMNLPVDPANVCTCSTFSSSSPLINQLFLFRFAGCGFSYMSGFEGQYEFTPDSESSGLYHINVFGEELKAELSIESPLMIAYFRMTELYCTFRLKDSSYLDKGAYTGDRCSSLDDRAILKNFLAFFQGMYHSGSMLFNEADRFIGELKEYKYRSAPDGADTKELKELIDKRCHYLSKVVDAHVRSAEYNRILMYRAWGKEIDPEKAFDSRFNKMMLSIEAVRDAIFDFQGCCLAICGLRSNHSLSRIVYPVLSCFNKIYPSFSGCKMHIKETYKLMYSISQWLKEQNDIALSPGH